MNLDIRLPMGYLFILLGGLLLIQGAVLRTTNEGVIDRFHANLWWGGVMAFFGICVLLLAKRAARRRP